MKNIDPITPFQITNKKTPFGLLTTLTVKWGISSVKSINITENTLFTANIYTKDETYNLVYTIIDTEGNVESYVEDDGILPTLFLSPEQENYVSVVPYHPDKDLEISIPIFNRERIEKPKGNRPFVGDFIGVVGAYSIFLNVEIFSDSKPDKMLTIEYKNGLLKKKKNIKLPLPRDNKMYIANNQIHLLATANNGWLHRQIDVQGNIIRERHIPDKVWFRSVISLSFDEPSYVLHEEEGKISIEVILPDDTCKTTNLIDIKNEFYNACQPIKIADSTFVIQFTTGFGNGWFTLKNGQLLEIFYSKDGGYKNLLTSEVLEIGNNNLAITSINKTVKNGYAVLFYPSTDEGEQNKTLIILNRKIQ